MKSVASFFCAFLFCLSAYAQFGVSIKYEKNNYREWTNVIQDPAGVSFENSPLHKNDLIIGLNYWHRLKKYRIEFLPEVSYAVKNTEENIIGIVATPNIKLGLTRFGVQYNTLIYPMDLEGDCNCPTWGKDGDFLKKGLFFMLSPGVDYMLFDSEIDGIKGNLEALTFKIGIGGGIDIGISEQITLSPFVMVNFYPSVSSISMNAVRNNVCIQCNIETIDDTFNSQVSAGIRLHFRPDYKY